MREIRLSGSEGGGALTGSPYPYPDPSGRFSLTNCLIPLACVPVRLRNTAQVG